VPPVRNLLTRLKRLEEKAEEVLPGPQIIRMFVDKQGRPTDVMIPGQWKLIDAADCPDDIELHPHCKFHGGISPKDL
jgi:hypothetical protein